MTYKLIDSGNQHKLEQFADFLIVRPCSQAVWKPLLPSWDKAHATFSREPGSRWSGKLPPSWVVACEGLKFKISATDFGHLGLFPEHAMVWKWMQEKIRPKDKVLNLFAYSGGATLAAAQAGAEVCHVDASKPVVAWARENAALNGLEKAPIRWIIDDGIKFLKREVRRGVRYDGIILDPPTFGRGNKGEVFKIERDLSELLELCKELLSSNPRFLILTSHTPGYTPLVMHHLMEQTIQRPHIESGEMVIAGPKALPCGTFARWHA
jgi:23S rRNA (cytosine1962-C5)-methyltransferase